VETFFFDFVVLPLAILVATLVASLCYYANREEIARRKTKKLIQSYLKEKTKQQVLMSKELANLDKLLEIRSIDEDTHERLKKLLTMTHENEQGETVGLPDYVSTKKLDNQ
jgi:hypothetical protein